jgi:crotonobetainyl-CoA:carnitine CoA-transferase CaiB-like acyl-CoA transferase
MNGPLKGIRVLDLSRILAGPWASQTLGDLGAEIIKIERPTSGDDTRQWGPPYLKDSDGSNTDDAAYFLCANRNKRSVSIDITHPDGQALIQELVKESDVVIENFKVGGLKKYNLDYDSLKSIKPDLIYCSITGFGQTGPYANRAGYDFLIQGMGGLMSVTGLPDGTAGGGPMKVGVASVDILTGLYAVIGIQAALQHRHNTGVGQHIDISLLDVQVATLANQALNYLTSGVAPTRLGNSHPNIVPYQSFATADGHMILAVGNDKQFEKFCQIADLQNLPTDPRYKTNAARVENRLELTKILQDTIQQKTLNWWIENLEKEHVPCGPINTIDRVFEDPQVMHRNMKVELDHATAGKAPSVGSPLKFSETPVAYDLAPPTLGQHTDSVLREILKIDPDQIKHLSECGIIDLGS